MTKKTPGLHIIDAFSQNNNYASQNFDIIDLHDDEMNFTVLSATRADTATAAQSAKTSKKLRKCTK